MQQSNPHTPRISLSVGIDHRHDPDAEVELPVHCKLSRRLRRALRAVHLELALEQVDCPVTLRREGAREGVVLVARVEDKASTQGFQALLTE